jgi:hypothetical protein
MIVDLLAVAAFVSWTRLIVRAVLRADRVYRAGLSFREDAFLIREGRA